MGKEDDIIKRINESGNKERAENLLKTRLGSALKTQGGKKAVKVDISGIVGLLTTKSEFVHFKNTVVTALTKIENLLAGLNVKVKDANETNDVLGRLLATLARKGLVSQEDIIAVSRAIEEGQARVKEIHEEHKDKTLSERLHLMRTENVDELAVEEYEHKSRRESANRIVALHKELTKHSPPKKEGDPIGRPKTFKEIVEVIRGEGHPEEQVREYLRAFFPWADGREGPQGANDWFCPECDKGFTGPDELLEGSIGCPECGRQLFPAEEFVRPPEFGGEKPEAEVSPKQVEGSETPEAEEVESPEVKAEEDPALVCPADVESATGHYDPATDDPEDDRFPRCAGCGTKRSEHKRVLRLVTPTDEALDEAEKGDDHSEDEETGEAE